MSKTEPVTVLRSSGVQREVMGQRRRGFRRIDFGPGRPKAVQVGDEHGFVRFSRSDRRLNILCSVLRVEVDETRSGQDRNLIRSVHPLCSSAPCSLPCTRDRSGRAPRRCEDYPRTWIAKAGFDRLARDLVLDACPRSQIPRLRARPDRELASSRWHWAACTGKEYGWSSGGLSTNLVPCAQGHADQAKAAVLVTSGLDQRVVTDLRIGEPVALDQTPGSGAPNRGRGSRPRTAGWGRVRSKFAP